MWELDYKESWVPKNWCFWTVVLERKSVLKSVVKEISPEYSLEGLMLKLKLQYFGHLMWRTDSLEKTLMLAKIEGRREKGTTEDEMVGLHHWLDGHEFQQALGVSDGQGSLVCCSPWGHKESDMTEWLNWRPSVEVQWLRLCFQGTGHGFNSWSGAKILYVAYCGQKKKKIEHVYIVCLHAEATF